MTDAATTVLALVLSAVVSMAVSWVYAGWRLEQMDRGAGGAKAGAGADDDG